ncbi:hypothetical protein SAMN05518672_101798 [Chitinophaga sp. CF118]|uniref:hypothetical protein n=1 Tax=Chitinophaga sp. CF118 TaxID=1884367 RepID=UPI0008E9D29A|nr:hypothetical protein [Chitinophaga sp. CF118]SFD15870.1 hypothetical protein SAMN05518672_101798 [Chitinophaga sp. CF118]
MYLKNNEPNSGSLLAELAGSIQNFNDSVDVYMNQIRDYEVFNPFQSSAEMDSVGINKPIPCEFWERLGIRHLILNTLHSRLEVPDHWNIENDKNNNTTYRWRNVKNDAILEELKTLFSYSSVVQFADWASVDGASDFWDGIFYDVIKPLGKRDFQFVFRLGDIRRRLVFEIDEILDIMGIYSSYGRVTLVLENNEADKLWSKLNGIAYDVTIPGSRPQDARERYLFIFNTMRIDSLIVLYANRTILYSTGQQSQFGGRSFENIYMPGQGKDCFDAGYRLGLLLQLETPHCIALGQVVSGAYVRNESLPGSEVLLTYIKDWMAEMSPDRYSSSLMKK